MTRNSTAPSSEDRVISLGPGLPAIPEKLLLAHAKGEILFIAGAGASIASGMPSFRSLVVDVYKQADNQVYTAIRNLPPWGSMPPPAKPSIELRDDQKAEVRRFIAGDYDVVLGMLERRMEGNTTSSSDVRRHICDRIKRPASKPSALHSTLISLSQNGGKCAIVTTNFDLLLEQAAESYDRKILSYSLGSIPRPSRSHQFSGVMHIHGALSADDAHAVDLIVTDEDFGEYYLRRNVVTDLIYDAARLYNLVLVGYSANDPPMRYLLNAISADGSRFPDLKPRYVFIGADSADDVAIEDWKARGIRPIRYDPSNGHAALTQALSRWDHLFGSSAPKSNIHDEIRRITQVARQLAGDRDRDLFDHMVRRESHFGKTTIADVASKNDADISWLDAILEISSNSRMGALL